LADFRPNEAKDLRFCPRTYETNFGLTTLAEQLHSRIARSKSIESDDPATTGRSGCESNQTIGESRLSIAIESEGSADHLLLIDHNLFICKQTFNDLNDRILLSLVCMG
jgi:hypothetical protein